MKAGTAQVKTPATIATRPVKRVSSSLFSPRTRKNSPHSTAQYNQMTPKAGSSRRPKLSPA
jgi:hypothetical protein